ncbi:hypothetical protein NFI96_026449 [Prochilodus magdalenae]|nr:hypothetical protein NFI96_026449 [Prochilodus magdalenae]
MSSTAESDHHRPDGDSDADEHLKIHGSRAASTQRRLFIHDSEDEGLIVSHQPGRVTVEIDNEAIITSLHELPELVKSVKECIESLRGITSLQNRTPSSVISISGASTSSVPDDNEVEMQSLANTNVMVPKRAYQRLNRNRMSIFAQELAVLVFTKETLQESTLTGKSSKGAPLKRQLDVEKVHAITGISSGPLFGQCLSSCMTMQLCICVLIVQILVITGSESVFPSVTVRVNDSATLPCSERCSGVVRWAVFYKPTEVLAECDQTSCRSVKEGYQMIHDQYLNGDLSLTIAAADLSKRARYTCQCGSTDVCDVTLKIEALRTTIQLQPGESLVLELDISDPVEVIYNSTGAAGPFSGQICTVEGRSLQCRPDYTQRSSLTAALELRGVTPSDSGVYNIIDTRNEEVIHTYTVTFQDNADAKRQNPKLKESCSCCASSGSDLEDPHISGSDLDNPHISGSDLDDLYISGSDLDNPHISGSDLDDLHISGSDLDDPHISGSDVDDPHISRSDLDDPHISGSDLDDLHISGSDLGDPHISGCDLDDLHISSSDLDDPHISGSDLDDPHISGSDLDDPHISGSDLDDPHVSDSDLDDPHVSDSDLDDPHILGSDLDDLHISGCDLDDLHISGSDLDDLHISGSDLDDPHISGNDQPCLHRDLGATAPVLGFTLSCVVQPSADGAALTGGLMEVTTARWMSVVVDVGSVRVSTDMLRAFLLGLLSFLIVDQCCSKKNFLSLLFTDPLSVSSLSSVKVKFNASATLLCSGDCTGVIKWTKSLNPTEVLAECNQTSCRSVKDGYQMIHDQYLQGNFCLVVTETDFSKRSWYTCQCDDTAICDVSLRLEAPEYSKQIYLGEPLSLDLPISEAVKVIFHKTGDNNPDREKLCQVKGREIKVDPPYEERVLFQASVKLNNPKNSDAGVYTIVDTENEETVSTYTITIRGEKEKWLWTIWEKREFGIGMAVGSLLGALVGIFIPPQIIKEKRLTYQRQEKKTSLLCCVPLCANSLRYNSEISFHRFPVDPEVRARWLTQIRKDNFSPLQSSRVCNRHYNTGHFVVTAVGKRKLNKGAVPCLFA